MKKNITKYICILTAVFCVFITGNKSIEAQAAGVVAIYPVGTGTIDKVQLKQIFMGDITKWPGKGGDLQILFNKDKEIMEAFCSKYLQMNYTSLNNIWVKKSQQEGVSMPRQVPSNVITTMVSNSDRFIGIVAKSDLYTNVQILE